MPLLQKLQRRTADGGEVADFIRQSELFDRRRRVSPADDAGRAVLAGRIGNRLGDYGVQEQKIPGSGDTQPWETCMTLNGHWGYFLGDENWKPARTCITNLVDIVSKGGNYLLNVGPTAEGGWADHR